MFPTIGKSKIPQSHSYPANATLISEALADVPQANVISISFNFPSDFKSHNRFNIYPVLAVTYHDSSVNQFSAHYVEALSGDIAKWSISVQAVPKAIRHHIQILLQSQGLPKMRNWLFAEERLISTLHVQSLRLTYNEKVDQLEYVEHFHS